jgi:hypothetical protein
MPSEPRIARRTHLGSDVALPPAAAPAADFLDGELGLGASAARVRSIGVTRELDCVVVLELERRLETLADALERLLALLLCSALALIAGNGAANRSRPQTDTVESSPYVHDNTHDLVVVLVLEVLSDSREHDVEPERVNVDRLLLLELECPFATVLVL